MIVEKEYTEGKTSFVSADVEHYTKTTKQPTTDMPVFYNPRMSLNRDFSVLFLSTYLQKNEIELMCEPLAGCGVRTLRYLNECQSNFQAVMFDANPVAVETIRKNIESNGLNRRATVLMGDAKVLLLKESRERRFDFVDLDPFGTPTPYLNGAIQSLQPKGGLLALTATDMPALCGVYPNVSLRKYGGFSIRAPFSHELAVRLLIGQVFNVASTNDSSISPLAVMSSDHYIRVWLRVAADKTGANKQAEEIGVVRYCKTCMHSDKLAFRTALTDLHFEHKRDECTGKLLFAGPLWIGKLYDKSFLKSAGNVLENLRDSLHKKVPSMFSMMSEEANLQKHMYIDLHALCDLHGLSPPKNVQVIENLEKNGFKATRTAFRPTAIRTDASVDEVAEIIAKLVGAE
ncbi:MAG: tRNA (guanine(10)-N(2))-dimethyltransferase [Promethearchaeota archaeon]